MSNHSSSGAQSDIKQNIKQAVVLAGGKSSRFIPYNQSHSKLAIRLMGRSIIGWTLLSLTKSGISEIVVVVGSQTPVLKNVITDFKQNNPDLNIRLVVQEQPKGMADAILSAKKLLSDRFLVINGSQFDADSLITQLKQVQSPVVISVKTTQKPWLYGIVETDGDRAVSLVEKPANCKAPAKRVVSAYILTKKFIDFMADKPSSDYLLEETLNEWMKTHQVKVTQINQITPSLKYSWDLLDIKNLLFDRVDLKISSSAKISKTAVIEGDIYIGDKALVSHYAVIQGPAYIGDNAVVGNYCQVRKKSVIEDNAEIQRYTDLNDSILMTGAHIHSGFVGSSIIGQEARIGANFVTANRRLDREEIQPIVKGRSVTTNRTRLGAIVGHEAKFGVNVSLMPGVIVNSSSKIYPGEVVYKNFEKK